MLTHANSITLLYERWVWRLADKLKSYPATKEEAGKLLGLKAQLAKQIVAMNELSEKVEDTRQRVRFTDKELEKVRAQKESLNTFHDHKMTRLRASREYEVNQIMAKCNKKLGKIKKSILDSEEVNSLSALMSHEMAIKDYLTILIGEGIAIPDDKPKSLKENF